jgi:hypothetical protein
VSIFLTGSHCKLRPNTKGILDEIVEGFVGSGLDGLAVHVLVDDQVVCSRRTPEGKTGHGARFST